MKQVHLLFSYIEYGEVTIVEGVFSSLESAEQARENFEANAREGTKFFVETHEVEG